MTTPYIHPKDIEKAREALWRSHQGTSSIRASLFNLVIYAKENERKGYLQNIAQSVIKKFPCRIILITESEDSSQSYLKTYVSDLKPDDKGTSIYCDMINFEVAGDHKKRIPFVVNPNLLADLPVYLLWGDDPSKNDPTLSELKELATRVIFDSEASESMNQFSKTLLKFYDKSNCDIGDLNWARLSPWRALFVHTFNDPEKLKTLKESKDIRITYNLITTKQFCHTKIQSIYFQAWIACKLGWKFESILSGKDEIIFKYSSELGLITITLLPGKNELVPPGRLLKFESFSIHNEHLLLEKNRQNMQQMTIRHSTPSHCEMPATFILDKEIAGKSMIHEIYSKGTRESFIEVLNVITSYTEGEFCN
jgi:glucose-6-phosphate dehydrogenase assembly protein OpcA